MTAKRRTRRAERLQDGIVVGLVVAALAFAATTRADRDGAWSVAALVEAPTPCVSFAAGDWRDACLDAALALIARR